MNYQKLAWHGLTFVFYLASIVIFYVYFYKEVTDYEPATISKCLLAWIITTYMNFLVQLAMIVIFMQLKSKSRHETTKNFEVVTDGLVYEDADDNEWDQTIERIDPEFDGVSNNNNFKHLTESLIESDIDDAKTNTKSANSTLQSDENPENLTTRASKKSGKSAISAMTKAPSHRGDAFDPPTKDVSARNIKTKSFTLTRQQKQDLQTSIIGQFVSSRIR